MYENFLATVPILASLEGYERAKIADALEPRSYAPGEEVVQQGQAGDEFYLIESGVAEVDKEGMGVVGELSKGDYFGGEFLWHYINQNVELYVADHFSSCLIACSSFLRTRFAQPRTSSRHSPSRWI